MYGTVQTALGAVELSSVGKGIEVCDAMLKKSDIRLVLNRVICPGKYLIIVQGSVDDVSHSVDAAVRIGNDQVVDSLIIPNPHPTLFGAITQTVNVTQVDSLGVVESYSMCTTLEAADTAAKKADIDLIEVRLAIMLAGKSFVTFTGDESAVAVAVQEASRVVRDKGMLLSATVISRPDKELVESLI